MGNGENPGLAPLLLLEIFKKVNFMKNYVFIVSLNYIEVYNETVIDLLSDSNNQIEIKNEIDKGASLVGIQDVTIKNVEEAYHYIG